MGSIDRIREQVSLSDFAFGQGITLQKNGNEWEGCCPLHQENTPSFTVFRGKDGIERFHCFGCQERGDVIDLCEKLKGMSRFEAIKYLEGGASLRAENVKPRALENARDPYEGIVLLEPVSGIRPGQDVRLYNPKRAGTDRAWGRAVPAMVHRYFRPDGGPLGYVLRNNLRDGAKETPMVCWVRLPSGEECWSRFPFPRPRSIYIGGGKPVLPAGQVLVVEGEKCADAVNRHTGRNAVSWAGGTFGIHHTNWEPLRNRDVVIWPDADAPGLKVASQIADILVGLDCRVRLADISGKVCA